MPTYVEVEEYQLDAQVYVKSAQQYATIVDYFDDAWYEVEYDKGDREWIYKTDLQGI